MNPSDSEPTKITPIPDASGGIRCLRNVGPTFSNNRFYDLQIWNPEGTPSHLVNRCDLGYGFMCPQNASKNTYFTGKNPFEINDMEVFKVDL